MRSRMLGRLGRGWRRRGQAESRCRSQSRAQRPPRPPPPLPARSHWRVHGGAQLSPALEGLRASRPRASPPKPLPPSQKLRRPTRPSYDERHGQDPAVRCDHRCTPTRDERTAVWILAMALID
eukprot:3852576-Rhodomonas_salina.2